MNKYIACWKFTQYEAILLEIVKYREAALRLAEHSITFLREAPEEAVRRAWKPGWAASTSGPPSTGHSCGVV